MIKLYKFSLTHKDDEMWLLINKTDHKILAIWAIDCAERVLPFFEHRFPNDKRPRRAIETLQDWIRTGVFNMSAIRKASLESRAAAREVGEDCPARSAARAAGQAIATAHVRTHSYGPAIYAQQAIFRASAPSEANSLVKNERDWQYNHLVELSKKQ